MLSIRILVNTSDVKRELGKVAEVAKDLTPFWRGACKEFLIRRFRRVFATNGYGRWRHTQRSNPILRDTRRMYRSYTRAGARDNINQVSERSFVWGTETPYAIYHETGVPQRNLAQRPVVGFIVTRRGFARSLEREVERYFEGALNG